MQSDNGGKPGDDVFVASSRSEERSSSNKCDHLRDRYASIARRREHRPRPNVANGLPRASAPEQDDQPDQTNWPHTAASLLYDAGMALDEIADLLGHSSTRMLEAHYRHRVRSSFNRHVEHVETIFG